MIRKRTKCIWGGLFFLVVIAGIGAITMLLWNALVPVIFGGIEITYWQAVGLLILSRLLLGGFGGFHRLSHMHMAHHQSHAAQFHQMSHEERKELIRNRMKSHGFGWCEREHPQPDTAQPDKE
ncbi:MAG: hypothetical protein LUG96_11930 [Tannerellaceae bacterium]|nr:hypothetical protein [Tannerellaceae bacterium]